MQENIKQFVQAHNLENATIEDYAAFFTDGIFPETEKILVAKTGSGSLQGESLVYIPLRAIDQYGRIIAEWDLVVKALCDVSDFKRVHTRVMNTETTGVGAEWIDFIAQRNGNMKNGASYQESAHFSKSERLIGTVTETTSFFDFGAYNKTFYIIQTNPALHRGKQCRRRI